MSDPLLRPVLPALFLLGKKKCKSVRTFVPRCVCRRLEKNIQTATASQRAHNTRADSPSSSHPAISTFVGIVALRRRLLVSVVHPPLLWRVAALLGWVALGWVLRVSAAGWGVLAVAVVVLGVAWGRGGLGRRVGTRVLVDGRRVRWRCVFLLFVRLSGDSGDSGDELEGFVERCETYVFGHGGLLWMCYLEGV